MRYLLSDEGMHVELTLEDLAELILEQRDLKKDSISIGLDKIQFKTTIRDESCFLTKSDYRNYIMKEIISRL